MTRKLLASVFAASAIAFTATGLAGTGTAAAIPNGSYLVPSEFQPGAYKAVANSEWGSGSVTICWSWACDSYDNSDIVWVDGSAYFEVPASALYVSTSDVNVYKVN